MRKPILLPANMEQNLLAYAAAASAAGIGLTFFLQSAQARVVYTPTDVLLKAGDSYNLDLNADGLADFVLRNTYRSSSSYRFWSLTAQAGDNGVIGTDHHRGFPAYDSALPKGTKIGPKRIFYSRLGRLASYYSGEGGPGWGGKWIDVKRQYLGLKLIVNGNVHYGWARMNVRVSMEPPISITGRLTGYAYETMADKPIFAGDTGTQTPQPVSLGHLALGANRKNSVSMGR